MSPQKFSDRTRARLAKADIERTKAERKQRDAEYAEFLSSLHPGAIEWVPRLHGPIERVIYTRPSIITRLLRWLRIIK